MQNVLSLVREYVGVERNITMKVKWCNSVPDGTPSPFKSRDEMHRFIQKRMIN